MTVADLIPAVQKIVTFNLLLNSQARVATNNPCFYSSLPMELIDILVGSVLVLIMFGIGVSLTLKDVSTVISAPKPLIVALISQMILLPIIAFTLCNIINVPNYIKVGIVILVASPGGTTAGFITYLFKGNTALSIILTTINAILTIFTIPIIVNFALKLYYGSATEFHLPFTDTMIEIFVLTAIPASLGVLLRTRNQNLAEKIGKYAKPILIILLGLVFLLKFLGGKNGGGITSDEISEILPSALILNVICFSTGFLMAKTFKLGAKNEISLSVESAVHNTTMAFLISGTLLHNEQFGKVSLVYAMFSFWTAVLFCFIISKLQKK